MERDTHHIDDPEGMEHVPEYDQPGALGEDVESPDDYEGVYDEEDTGGGD
ncbi:MAG: hypothetical protein ACOZNI_33755 [Myxococcota bacterium]